VTRGPARSRRAPAPAFTLLEAVLALAILAAVIGATLGARTQGLRGKRLIEERLNEHMASQALFDMLNDGLLPPPAIDPETADRLWRGTHMGHDYTIRARRAELPSAIPAEQLEARSDRIIMYRYTIEYRGRTTHTLWHR
jgi:hypothetical protein